eukprot:scaffold19271_cov28-Tisochrysis_lutea.AAC.12
MARHRRHPRALPGVERRHPPRLRPRRRKQMAVGNASFTYSSGNGPSPGPWRATQPPAAGKNVGAAATPTGEHRRSTPSSFFTHSGAQTSTCKPVELALSSTRSPRVESPSERDEPVGPPEARASDGHRNARSSTRADDGSSRICTPMGRLHWYPGQRARR